MKKNVAQALFLLLLALSALLLNSTLNTGHDWGGDFSSYIMQAQSIANGTPQNFIEKNSFTIERSPHLGPIAYPWGFPVLLAPFYKVFGLNMIALKSVGALSFLFFLLLLWVGFQEHHSYWGRLCLVALFALNPYMLTFLNNVLSDIPFMLFSTLGIVLIGEVIIRNRGLTNSRIFDHILLGASIAAAFFIRPNGILLLPALGTAQLIALRKNFREPSRDLLVHLIPYLFFFSSALLWELMLPKGGASYIALLNNFSAESIKHNLKYYFLLPIDFFTGVPDDYVKLLYGASLPVAIVGALQRYRSDFHILVFSVLTLALYILWSGIQGLRFIFPLLPFYCSFFLTGLKLFQFAPTAAERALRKTISALLILLVLFYFGTESAGRAGQNMDLNRESPGGPFAKNSLDMFSFIKQNTEPESVVTFFKPRVMRMMTGRDSFERNTPEGLEPGDYLCLSPGGPPDENMARLVSEGRALLTYENSEFKVYKWLGNDKREE